MSSTPVCSLLVWGSSPVWHTAKQRVDHLPIVRRFVVPALREAIEQHLLRRAALGLIQLSDASRDELGWRLCARDGHMARVPSGPVRGFRRHQKGEDDTSGVRAQQSQS